MSLVCSEVMWVVTMLAMGMLVYRKVDMEGMMLHKDANEQVLHVP